MKLILLAATALIAVPAFAQDTTAAGAPTTQTTPPTTADPAQTPPADPSAAPADPAAAPADQTATPPAADPAMTTQGAAQPPMTTGSGAPVGGYQPSQPALRGTATPGGPVVFQAAPSPSEAYPAPAPKAEYPICKKGQFDGCRQRGGK